MDEIDYRLSEFFRVLGNGIRLGILMQLKEGKQSVKALTGHFDRSQQAVSRHLGLLRDFDLVRAETEGKHHVYHLKRPEVVEKCLELRPYVKRIDD